MLCVHAMCTWVCEYAMCTCYVYMLCVHGSVNMLLKVFISEYIQLNNESKHSPSESCTSSTGDLLHSLVVQPHTLNIEILK